MSDAADRMSTIAQAALGALPLRVEDVSVTPAGKRRIVRISVDDDLSLVAPGDETTPVPPVSLDSVADATRVIGDALDDANVLGSTPYVLEVTSPGVSRPLSLIRHFRRNVGRLVSVHLTDDAPTREGVARRPVGRIVAVGDGGVRLRLPATKSVPEQDITLAREHIRSADVQVEFTRLEDEEDD